MVTSVRSSLAAAHLAGQGALPDQLVELLLLVIVAGDKLREIGWTDGFVGFLGAVVLGFELAEFVIFVAELRW